jgi:hypothetical protein
MNRLEAIEKAAGKKGNRIIAEFVFDVCVDRPERLSTVEIIDRLECVDIFTNQSTVNKLIRKYVEYGFCVGEQPETRGNDFMSGFNWNPKPLTKNQFKHLKGAW